MTCDQHPIFKFSEIGNENKDYYQEGQAVPPNVLETTEDE